MSLQRTFCLIIRKTHRGSAAAAGLTVACGDPSSAGLQERPRAQTISTSGPQWWALRKERDRRTDSPVLLSLSHPSRHITNPSQTFSFTQTGWQKLDSPQALRPERGAWPWVFVGGKEAVLMGARQAGWGFGEL